MPERETSLRSPTFEAGSFIQCTSPPPLCESNSMSASWADLTIRLALKANGMSARLVDLAVTANSMSVIGAVISP